MDCEITRAARLTRTDKMQSKPLKNETNVVNFTKTAFWLQTYMTAKNVLPAMKKKIFVSDLLEQFFYPQYFLLNNSFQSRRKLKRA